MEFFASFLHQLNHNILGLEEESYTNNKIQSAQRAQNFISLRSLPPSPAESGTSDHDPISSSQKSEENSRYYSTVKIRNL